jgi:hypothetical protein
MLRPKKYHFFSDAGHGWVKVPIADLKVLGIADKISGCSLQRGDFAYLEEDCDATLFGKAFFKYHFNNDDPTGEDWKMFNEKYSVSHNSNNSTIRSYDPYTFLTEEQEKEKQILKAKMLENRNWSKKAIRKIVNASLESLKYWQTEYHF